MPRGVLLHGKPGVGKTVMAKSVVTDGIACVELRAADCIAADSEKNIISAFENARQKAPCVLLIDEIDKIAETSEAYYMEGNDSVMKLLLQELDGQKDNSGVLVIATCNNYNRINPALLRSGRFDRIIEIPAPNIEDRVEIINYYFSKINLENRCSAEYFAKITTGYTGAQLECIINEAGITAMQNNTGYIDISMLENAMNRLAFKALAGRIVNKTERWSTAIHEAGHATVALNVAPESITTVSIIPHGNVRGHVRIMRNEEITQSATDIENQIMVALGGIAAEEVILKSRYMSSGSDLANAARYLYALITEIGVYNIAHTYLSEHFGCRMPPSEEMCREITDIFKTKINEFYEKVKSIIEENRELIERIARVLVEKSCLAADELFELNRSVNKEKIA
jgi:ATP-dependent Zn protease